MADDILLEVGRTGRAHGVRGAVYVDLLTDRTERLATGAALLVGDRWCTVAVAKPAGTRWLVQFEGVADRTAAEALASKVVRAAPLARTEADDDGWYVDELIGASVVTTAGEPVGTCVAVVANPAHDLLELDSGALVPIVFVATVREGCITIDPPTGLFDLGA